MDGFTNKQVAEITKETASSIAYYTNKGFVEPSISKGSGRGSNRIYSKKDILKFLLIKELSKHGFSLKKIVGVLNRMATQGVFGDDDPLLNPDAEIMKNYRVFILIYDKETENMVVGTKMAAEPNVRKDLVEFFTNADDAEKAFQGYEANLKSFTINMLDHRSAVVIDVTSLWTKIKHI